MAEFHLKVVASDRVFYDGLCKIAIVPGLDGEWAFMAHHGDIVVAVQPGMMRFQKTDDTWETAVVGSGFAQTANNRTMVIVDTAERPEEIDEVRARESLERAQEEMRQKQSVQEYRISQASLARAISRLKGKKDKNINL